MRERRLRAKGIIAKGSKAAANLQVSNHICPLCRTKGHLAQDCKNPPYCSICQTTGHTTDECQYYEDNLPICKKCKAAGHLAPQCKQDQRMRPNQEAGAPKATEPRSTYKRRQPEDGHGQPQAYQYQCRNCGKMGHMSKDCPETHKIQCGHCGVKGHKAAGCRNAKYCTICQAEGHTNYECNSKVKWGKSFCYKCLKYGHTESRCRQGGFHKRGDGMAQRPAHNPRGTDGRRGTSHDTRRKGKEDQVNGSQQLRYKPRRSRSPSEESRRAKLEGKIEGVRMSQKK